MKKILLLIVLLTNFILVNAQNQISSYNLPVGYTQAEIRQRNAFHVDANNNKWIGFNWIGLGRFDGSVWTMFDSLNSTLPSNHVYSIASNTNTLWVGTLAGLSKYDGTTFTNYDNTNSSLPVGVVKALVNL